MSEVILGLRSPEEEARIAAAQAARAKALDKVEAAVDIYIADYIGRPYSADAFINQIELILYSGTWGCALWPIDQATLLARALRAARQNKRLVRVRQGRPAIPAELMDAAILAVVSEHENKAPLTVDEDGAYNNASLRILKDLGLRVSPSAIKAFHQKQKAVKAK